MTALEELFSDLPETIVPNDVAQRLGLTKQGVYIWLRDGTIPGYKMGSSWFIIKAELIAELKKGSNRALKDIDVPEE